MEKADRSVKNDQDEGKKLLKDALRLLLKIAVFAIVLIILFGYLFGLMQNTSPDMQPSFREGDLVLYSRIENRFAVDEVVVVRYEDREILGRIVAVAGDEVNITSDGLTINGALVQEPNARGETTGFAEGISFPMTVPEGMVFVLGDNREHATDSRIFGCIETENVQGRVIGLFRHRGL